jgi:hypothetical protein
MPLYRKPKDIPYQSANPDAVKDIPFATTTVYPEITIEFVNAQVEDKLERQLALALLNIDSTKSASIDGTNLKSIATHKGTLPVGKVSYSPVPIFIGSPEEPTEEFLYFNPEVRQNKPSFFSSLKTDCETSFLFAQVKPAFSTNRGIYRKSPVTTPPPYAVSYPADALTPTTTSTIFVSQRGPDIEIRSMEVLVVKMGLGLSVVSDIPVNYDTWYDNSWNTFSVGGVGFGYTNVVDKTNSLYAVGSRYDWTFGSIFLTKSFGDDNPIRTEFGLQEINYEYSDSTVKLVGWKYLINDTAPYRYKNTESIIAGKLMEPVDSRKVYGRQLLTYVLKSFEEGRCITIGNKHGGIEIGVSFYHNGNCCECDEHSSDSSSSSSIDSESSSSSSDSSHSSSSISSLSSDSSDSSSSYSSSSSSSSSSESSTSSLITSDTSESSNSSSSSSTSSSSSSTSSSSSSGI